MITVLLGMKLFSLVGNAGTLRFDCVILGDLRCCNYYYYYYYIVSTILTLTFYH